MWIKGQVCGVGDPSGVFHVALQVHGNPVHPHGHGAEQVHLRPREAGRAVHPVPQAHVHQLTEEGQTGGRWFSLQSHLIRWPWHSSDHENCRDRAIHSAQGWLYAPEQTPGGGTHDVPRPHGQTTGASGGLRHSQRPRPRPGARSTSSHAVPGSERRQEKRAHWVKYVVKCSCFMKYYLSIFTSLYYYFSSRHWIINKLSHFNDGVRNNIVHHRVGSSSLGDGTQMPHPIQLETSWY